MDILKFINDRVFFLLLFLYSLTQCFFDFSNLTRTLASGFGLLLFVYLIFCIYVKSFIDGYKNILLIIIPILVILSYLFSAIINNSIYDLHTQYIKITLIISFLAYLYLFKPKEIFFERFIICINLLVYFSIIICYFLNHRFSFSSFYGGTEYYGYISSPHSLGLALVSFCTFYFYKMIYSNKYYYSILFILDVILLIVFRARTFQVGLLISLGIFLLLASKIHLKYRIFSILLVSTLLYLSMPYFDDYLMRADTKADYLFSSSNDINSMSSGRTKFWNVIFTSGFERSDIEFFFGNGLGSTLSIMQKKMSWSIGAHNDYLQLFFEFGVVGFFLFFFIYFIFLRKIIKRENFHLIVPLISAHFITSFVDGSIFYTYSLLILSFTIYYFFQQYNNTQEVQTT